jgi:2-amino-4-hydroxy-6-hydroxymethyldihydropteridine diphosphokinase
MGTGSLYSSQLYRSEPWGYSEQNEFINQVVGVKPQVSVDQALTHIQEFERNEGRERTIKWGPRTIDIDILYWPNHVCNDPRLTLPHPRLHQRRFVLEPWVELAPNLIIPGLEKSLTQLLESCPDTGWLQVLSPYSS